MRATGTFEWRKRLHFGLPGSLIPSRQVYSHGRKARRARSLPGRLLNSITIGLLPVLNATGPFLLVLIATRAPPFVLLRANGPSMP